MGSGCAIAPQNASLQRKVPATHSIVPRIRTIRRCKFATPRDFNLNVPAQSRTRHVARNTPIEQETQPLAAQFAIRRHFMNIPG